MFRAYLETGFSNHWHKMADTKCHKKWHWARKNHKKPRIWPKNVFCWLTSYCCIHIYTIGSIFMRLYFNQNVQCSYKGILNYYAWKMGAPRSQCFSPQMSNWHPWQLKKSKSWVPFWSYQLNSTANSAHLAHFWVKWAVLAMLSSW